jgi:superfamily II DNA/RNA helicase
VTKTFRDLGVDAALCDALAAQGITHPFPIQELTLPLALDGHDLIGQARTGTGKTLGFGLPLLQRLDADRGETQALVVVPTRELCLQVYEDLKIGSTLGLSSIAVYGGVGYDEQIDALRGGAHVVVGTPGRLLDHLNRGNLDLSNVTQLVLDEADEMLDMGFLPDVERLIEACTGRDRHTMLFSATMPTAIVKLARRYLDHPTFMRADHEERNTAPEVVQHFFQVHRMDKPRLLARILQAPERGGVYVFVRTKHMADRLVNDLEDLSVPAIAIHGDLRQTTREKNLDRFREGKANVLVCTEVAARGLDVSGVTHVVNYDCPDDEKMYLHRIGRTARAGEAGVAITFAEFNETDRLNVIRKAVGATDRQVLQVFSTSEVLAELFDLPEATPWARSRRDGGDRGGRDGGDRGGRDGGGRDGGGRDGGRGRNGDRDKGGRGERRGGDRGGARDGRRSGSSDGRPKRDRRAETAGGSRDDRDRRRTKRDDHARASDTRSEPAPAERDDREVNTDEQRSRSERTAKSGRNGSGRSRGERSGTERSGSERSRGERSGDERSGAERSGSARSRGERSGGEGSGGERPGGDGADRQRSDAGDQDHGPRSRTRRRARQRDTDRERDAGRERDTDLERDTDRERDTGRGEASTEQTSTAAGEDPSSERTDDRSEHRPRVRARARRDSDGGRQGSANDEHGGRARRDDAEDRDTRRTRGDASSEQDTRADDGEDRGGQGRGAQDRGGQDRGRQGRGGRDDRSSRSRSGKGGRGRGGRGGGRGEGRGGREESRQPRQDAEHRDPAARPEPQGAGARGDGQPQLARRVKVEHLP